MEVSEIDVRPLRRAVERLEEGLAQLAGAPGNTLLRDGVMQRFEFSYELSHSLAAHVPGCEVWVFGSRVTGRVKAFSDLDLWPGVDGRVDPGKAG